MNLKALIREGKGFIINNHPIKIYKRNKFKKEFLIKKPIEELNMKEIKDFEIYTVAFNNWQVIEFLSILIKKNLIDEHKFIVVDNSDDKDASNKIKSISIEHGHGYIKLAENKLYSSQSHGIALNYIFHNYIQKRNPKYFGIIDHDIFPIKKTSILDKLSNQDFYGYLIDKNRRSYTGDAWMLRPGFCFYKNIFTKMDFSVKKSFFPLFALDTGGGNYKKIYKKYNKENIQFCERKAYGITHGGETQLVDYADMLDLSGFNIYEKYNQIFELIQEGEWYHKGATYYLGDKKSNEYKKYLLKQNSFYKEFKEKYFK
ncbi:MAG: hypothetical protein V3575_03065 [Candidatus Absconditabacteria bacterium]